jgi:hypothetical protein
MPNRRPWRSAHWVKVKKSECASSNARGGGGLGSAATIGVLISSIRFADSPLDCVMRWTAVIGAPSTTNRTSVGRAVSALYRPAPRASIPVSIAVSISVARRWRIRVLGVGGCPNRDCADKSNGQEDLRRCIHHGLHTVFNRWPKIATNYFSFSRSPQWLALSQQEARPITSPPCRNLPIWAFTTLGEGQKIPKRRRT